LESVGAALASHCIHDPAQPRTGPENATAIASAHASVAYCTTRIGRDARCMFSDRARICERYQTTEASGTRTSAAGVDSRSATIAAAAAARSAQTSQLSTCARNVASARAGH
jgi:hypothetical protein